MQYFIKTNNFDIYDNYFSECSEQVTFPVSCGKNKGTAAYLLFIFCKFIPANKFRTESAFSFACSNVTFVSPD